MKILVLAILYGAIWIALSGHFDFLLLSFGVVSVLIVLYTLRRMRIVDKTPVKFQINLMSLMMYCSWLIKEILKSNITVAKTILSPQIKVKQNIFYVPLTPKSEAAQVIFANSITLTPGTITVETEKKNLLVHSLNFSDSTEDEIAEMGQKVSKCERRST
tara:strand:- start:194 stop:673 length:480 start_codon:yes stop_codon:yes gene_type:complete